MAQWTVKCRVWRWRLGPFISLLAGAEPGLDQVLCLVSVLIFLMWLSLLLMHHLPQKAPAVIYLPVSVKHVVFLLLSLLNKVRRQQKEKTFVTWLVVVKNLHTPSQFASLCVFQVCTYGKSIAVWSLRWAHFGLGSLCACVQGHYGRHTCMCLWCMCTVYLFKHDLPLRWMRSVHP